MTHIKLLDNIMKYALRVMALGHSNLITLESSEYGKIKESREVLSLFAKFTENYRIVLDAYERVEDAIHQVSISNLLHGFGGYSESLQRRIHLNSALIGYLASARYFLDSSDKILPKLISETKSEEFVAFRASIYDNSKEYRFIEALRNYVQHRDLPIDSLKHNNFIEETDNREDSDLVTSISLLASREKLSSDNKFKREVLEGMPELIDIIQCLRAHMARLWSMHDRITKNHSDIASSARTEIEAQIERYKREIGGTVLGLHAVEATDSDEIEEKVPLLLDWDDARLESLKHIGNLARLQRWYVSGKIKRT